MSTDTSEIERIQAAAAPSGLRAIARGAALCALLASSAALGEGGSWQKHQYSFAYLGFTSTYSCDGLASKLQMLLIASGARSDAKARPGACAAGFGRPDTFARADLTFYTLAPASTVKAPASADESAAAPIAGRWLPVAIAARKPRELTTGDCELVEQFRSIVLPMFATRNVGGSTTCVPHQESGSVIDLKFDSFSAAPMPRRPP